MKTYELRAGNTVTTFTDFSHAEDRAEYLVVSGEAEHVELHRLLTQPNPYPGALPKEVTRILRLDVYSIEDNRLTRKQVNIF